MQTPMAADADQDDLLLAHFKLESNAILQVDGNGVQSRQPTLARGACA
jgi:hypothetical protein